MKRPLSALLEADCPRLVQALVVGAIIVDPAAVDGLDEIRGDAREADSKWCRILRNQEYP